MFIDPITRRLVKVFGCLIALLLLGSTGYVCIEGWPFGDGFFMTVITLSTVGYGETHDLTQTGRWFTSILIFCCLVTMTCWTAALTSFLVEDDLSGRYLRRRTLKMISKLQNHTIVCGTDLMAQAVIERLMRRREEVVVVDDDKQQLEALGKRFRRLLTVEGKPTNELTLAQANVISASNVVAAMDSEIDNLLIGITCKDLGSDVAVYAQSNDVTISNRMRKAGIDEVISPCQLCGDRIAELVIE